MSELDELREQCMQQAVTIEQMRLVMRDVRYLIADFDLAFARHTVQRMDVLIAGAALVGFAAGVEFAKPNSASESPPARGNGK